MNEGAVYVPKFNINKLRSAGLRYLVADMDGQMWAYEAVPVRAGDHWRLNDKHLCPPNCDEKYQQYWDNLMHWRWMGREFCCPIYETPVELTFTNEPYDIVENGLVSEHDFRVWPEANLRKMMIL